MQVGLFYIMMYSDRCEINTNNREMRATIKMEKSNSESTLIIKGNVLNGGS